MKQSIALALVALSISSAVSAQVAPAPGQAIILVPAPQTVLRTGTSIPVRMMTEMTTKGKKLRVGDRFNIEVSEPIMLNGQLVIPTGTPGMGEITSVRNKGMWGKSGNIEARLLYIRVGDRQIRLSGTFTDKGVTGSAGVVGAAVFVPIAGFFLTGTSAVIPAGSTITGFLDEDVPVAFAPGTAAQGPVVASAATPMVVAATQPLPAVTPVGQR